MSWMKTLVGNLRKNIHSESGQKAQDQQAEQQFGSSEDQKVIKQLKN
jgi:hypothetical protein